MQRFNYFLSILFFFISAFSVFAQKDFLCNRITYKLSYSTTNAISSAMVNENTYFIKNKKPNYQISINYAVNKSIDFGVYFGYSKLFHEFQLPYNPMKDYYELYSKDSTAYIGNSYPTWQHNSNAFSYGLKSEIHLLPLFIKEQNIRFDVYVSPTIGAVSESYKNINQQIISKPIFIEYSIGFGAGYNFTKHFGIFGEYKIGRFYNDDKSQLRGGLVFKF